MKGIIIINQDIGHNQYKIDRFNVEASKLDISLTHIINDGKLFYIEDGKVVTKLDEADFILYLDKDIYTAYALEKAHYKLFNDADFTRLCDDKALTFVKCSNLDIDMPKTIIPPLVYKKHSDEKLYLEFLKHVESELSFPLIAKLSYSSLGLGVYKISNMDELIAFYLEHMTSPFVFQKFEKTSIGRTLRVLIINEEVIGGIERISEVDFRSNTTQSYSKKYEFDEKYLTFAKNIAKKLKIKYAGIDILFGEDGPKLCEINSNAFFEEFEKTTGINVAYKYLEYIKKEVLK